jgi:hypothetical protein
MQSNYVPQPIFKQQPSKIGFYKESYPLINHYNVDKSIKNVDNLWINSLPVWIKNEAACGYVDKLVYKSMLCTIHSHYKWISKSYPHVYKHVNNFYNSQNLNDLCYKHLWITL